MSKRAVDLVGALVVLSLLSPVLLLAGVLIRLTTGAPVLFRQTRPGLHGRPFVLYKFRTMRGSARAPTGAEDDRRRVTKVGRLLRRLSVDELPQLWNVVRGEMSLIGPRPLLMEYLAHYTPEQARRHSVKPGLTGWAQVKGRDHLAWEERFRLDVFYAEHHNAWMDLKIAALTVVRLVDWRELDSDVEPLSWSGRAGQG